MMADATDLLDVPLVSGMGLDLGALSIAGSRPPADLDGYWAKRRKNRIYLTSLLYTHYFCRRKDSVADIGCHCSPLVLMVPGFSRRFAIDPSPASAEAWAEVDGATYIQGRLDEVDLPKLIGSEKFDLILCNQVIEHLDDPAPFCAELLQKSRRLVISTTFETPAGHVQGHVQDPIDYTKFRGWFGRKPLMSTLVSGPVGGKIVAVF